MTIICILLSLEIAHTVDSLKVCLEEHRQLSTALELNNLYLKMGEFGKGITMLREHERYFTPAEKAIIIYTIGSNHFLAGEILAARDEYLKLVSLYPHSEIANDGLEMLYLIESARNDTVLLKRLAHSLYLYRTDQVSSAEDSLKSLLTTAVSAYAHYYLAVVYLKKDDVPLALSALQELNSTFPNHTLYNATLLLAEIHLQANNEKEAQKVLEDLLVRAPTSIYAVRAREMLDHIKE